MAALENIGNLWDQLSELHQKDPQKYQEVIEESAKEYAKLKLPPLPHTCILVREKVIKCCWQRSIIKEGVSPRWL